MFDHTSRYYNLEDAEIETPEGKKIIYKRRRFLPQAGDIPDLGQVTVLTGDRPDLVTARTLGDPEQYWRIADANNAMNPFELTEKPGGKLKIPNPQP